MSYIKRNIINKLEKSLTQSPVTLLIGARQTGKTTLVKRLGALKDYHYVTFDDLKYLSGFREDPDGFIKGLKKPVILDEVQRVPDIFLSIKAEVDEQREFGRYVLTGSANPLLLPKVSESLAGRMQVLKLYPLSQGELIGTQEHFIEDLFNQDAYFENTAPISKEQLAHILVTGGYPNVQSIAREQREDWFDSYISTILQRDVKDIANIQSFPQFLRLLQLFAVRSGTLLNTAELSRSSTISNTTVHRYMMMLQALFFVDFQPAWSANLTKQLVRSPKSFLVDYGLLSFLLGSDAQGLLNNNELMGKVCENFVFSELMKQATWSGKRIKNFHFRTTSGVEVDFILQDYAGNIVGIEVKSKQTAMAKDFKGLKKLQELVGDKFVRGVVLYAGDQVVPFGKHLHAVPISCLWR